MLTYSLRQTATLPCTCHILTRNDRNTIIDCLESVLRPKIFEKILILIDTSSEDGTGRIISAYRSKFPEIEIVPYAWSDPPDFAAARNYCISLTRTPYAFWLDGDEILKKPEQLRAMVARATGQAFQMWVISPVATGFHNMFQPRLFPVVPGVRFECPVFERLDWSLRRSGVRIEPTEADPIWHPGYTNTATLRRKNQRNMRIMEKYLSEHRTDDPQRRHILTQYTKLKGAT
jgi:glycosyltransferase involved in cell wall biosynthesis